jgi:hypothetical protein
VSLCLSVSVSLYASGFFLFLSVCISVLFVYKSDIKQKNKTGKPINYVDQRASVFLLIFLFLIMSFSPSVSPSLCFSVALSLRLSVFLSFCLSVFLSLCLSASTFIVPSFCYSGEMNLSFFLSVSPYLCFLVAL